MIHCKVGEKLPALSVCIVLETLQRTQPHVRRWHFFNYECTKMTSIKLVIFVHSNYSHLIILNEASALNLVEMGLT